jgi:paraquat-inducible protein A
MQSQQTGFIAVYHCRRCRGQFTMPATPCHRWLVCPHCGASVRPLAEKWRSNRNAAMLSCLSLLVLVPAALLPFMSIVKLGQAESYSILGGIRQLFDDGQLFLAIIIFTFSLVFPVVKLVLLLIATSSLVNIPTATRQLLHRLSAQTAKYSMLDVFILAILVVVIKLGESTEVHVRSGTILFCVAIALSILASSCVEIEEAESNNGG